MRLQKARSHDLDGGDLEAVRGGEQSGGGRLLRQAIKGDVLAKRAALRSRSASGSAGASSDDEGGGTSCCVVVSEGPGPGSSPSPSPSPVTSPSQCVTAGGGGDAGKFAWDKNRNGSTSVVL